MTLNIKHFDRIHISTMIRRDSRRKRILSRQLPDHSHISLYLFGEEVALWHGYNFYSAGGCRVSYERRRRRYHVAPIIRQHSGVCFRPRARVLARMTTTTTAVPAVARVYGWSTGMMMKFPLSV